MASGDAPIERELKLAVPDAGALARVARAAEARDARIAPVVVQENHLFDTPALLLHARDLVLRLRVERGAAAARSAERFVLTAKGNLGACAIDRNSRPNPLFRPGAVAPNPEYPSGYAGSDAPCQDEREDPCANPDLWRRLRGPAGDPDLHVRAEEEAEIPAAVGREVLAGRADALATLARALGRPSALLAEIRALVGPDGGGLAEIGAFTNERTRVGPLDLGAGGAVVALELDRTRLPDGSEACEVELELPAGPAEAVDAGRALLRELLAAAGVEGLPAGPKSGRFHAALERLRRGAE